MTKPGAIRLTGFALLALGALAASYFARSWTSLVLAFFGLLLLGAVVDRFWLRRLSPDERKRVLEDRVRNPSP